ncbi:MAG: FAD-dependent oxidoreductase, partial [Thermoleophilaceae bacterium]
MAVIGGGIAGMSTALALKRDGARVAVLERGTVACGATGFPPRRSPRCRGRCCLRSASCTARRALRRTLRQAWPPWSA